MFEASVDGQLYDPEKWSKFYRPSGVQIANATGAVADPDEDTVASKPAPVAARPAPTPPPAPQATTTAAPAADAGAKPSVDDILKMIRSRSA
jgi:hypothetical protein